MDTQAIATRLSTLSLIVVGIARVGDVASSGSAGRRQQRSIGGAYVSSGEGPADASGSDRTGFAARRVGVGAGQLHRADVPDLRSAGHGTDRADRSVHGDRDAEWCGVDAGLVPRPRAHLLLPRRLESGHPGHLPVPPDRAPSAARGGGADRCGGRHPVQAARKNFRRGLAARRGGQGPQAHRARDLLRRGGPGRRTSFPGPAGVPAGDGSTVAAEAGAVQGRPRRVHAPLPGGLPPRPAHPRRRGRRLPRKVPARVVRELHLHHPVAHQRVAVRPRPAAHRKTRPPSLPTIRRPASATSPARPSGSATRTTRPRPATPACRT